jgi:hypothetical protein
VLASVTEHCATTYSCISSRKPTFQEQALPRIIRILEAPSFYHQPSTSNVCLNFSSLLIYLLVVLDGPKENVITASWHMSPVSSFCYSATYEPAQSVVGNVWFNVPVKQQNFQICVLKFLCTYFQHKCNIACYFGL